MKSGTTDPFANDDEETEDDQPAETATTDRQTTKSDSPTEPDTADSQPDSNTESSSSNTGQIDRSDLPRLVGRKSVKEDRNGGVHQLFVYEDTDQKEQTARRDLEDRFDEDLYKFDAREAIYLAGMQNIDDAEAILREWGADF